MKLIEKSNNLEVKFEKSDKQSIKMLVKSGITFIWLLAKILSK